MSKIRVTCDNEKFLENNQNESEWKQYKRKGLSEMRPYVEGSNVLGISISRVDINNGSPKLGDMIARNPEDHDDMWLVSKEYFYDNLEPV